MNRVIDALISKKIVCKSVLQIDKKDLQTAKNINCFLAVDEKAKYIGLWYRLSKSRLDKREVNSFLILLKRLEELKGHRILKNIIMIKSPISTKANKLFKENGWSTVDVPM